MYNRQPRTMKWLTPVMVFVMLSLTAFAAKKGKPPVPPREFAVEMGAPFYDHMILQREMTVPVWGWAKPGTTVTVEFSGQKKSGTAAEDGKWMVELDPLTASFEPAEMTITETGGKTETLKDILVGEVWMCSGQSNMQWNASACIVGRKLQAEIKERVEAGKEKQPIIREGKVTNVFSALRPRDRGTRGKWGDQWGGFSAIAFAFSYDVWKEVQVPVGILNCSFSTTQIQAWCAREGFAAGQDEYTKAIYKKVLEADYTTPEHKAAFGAYYTELKTWAADSAERVKKGLNPAEKPQIPGNLNGNRDACWMYNGKIFPMAPYAIRGAIWNQGYANGNEGIVYRNNLHSLIRGWRTIWNRPDLPVYFHQFYGLGKSWDGLSLNSIAEMRLGTWLAHNDIPNAAMASQIDITGGVHYYNKAVPGQRLARHALKNQYGKDIIANGPMYKGYKVEGNKLILELDHAQGLCVGQSMTVRGGYADPIQLEDAEGQVKLFYIAGKDRTWYPATVTIVGETIELTADGLTEPHGVAYGTQGVGTSPSIYNKAMLPLTPFIYFDNKLVISKQWDVATIKMPAPAKQVEFLPWPDEYLKVAGVERDPKSYGLQGKYYKLWLLAPQFAHHCVIQSGVPTRFYGKAIPKSVVNVSFAGTEKSITLGDEQDEWELTFPALEASAKPNVLHAVCTLNGEIAHERKITNVVVGDVWYVAAMEQKLPGGPGIPRSGPAALDAWKDENPQIRMFKSYGRRAEGMPTRFKLNASGNPISRAFPRWSPANSIAKPLAERIHATTGKPVGIIVLDTPAEAIKSWVGYENLKKIPAWKTDVSELAVLYETDPKTYTANVEEYVKRWQGYWTSLKTDPAFESGALPKFPGGGKIETRATMTYNQSICAFTPGNFKAIFCLTGKAFIGDDGGAAFGPQFSVMANGWKEAFAYGKEGIDPHFVYALPSGELAPKLTKPSDIKGASTAIELKQWIEIKHKTVDTVDPETKRKTRSYHLIDDAAISTVLDEAVKAVYK